MLLCESGQSFCAETFILLKTHLFAGTQQFRKNRPVLTHLPNDFKTGQQSRFPSKPAWLLIAPSLRSTLWAVCAGVVLDFIPAAGGTLLWPNSALQLPVPGTPLRQQVLGLQALWPVDGVIAELEVSVLGFPYTQYF